MPGSSGTPSISNSVFARTVSHASHVSPSLGPLQTVLMPSRGRRPALSLRRMRRRRASWSIVRSNPAHDQCHLSAIPETNFLPTFNIPSPDRMNLVVTIAHRLRPTLVTIVHRDLAHTRRRRPDPNRHGDSGPQDRPRSRPAGRPARGHRDPELGRSRARQREARDHRGGQAMIRLRRASAIVALCLLSLPATAYAECAWVLWAVGANVALTLSAWPTREECVSDQARNEPS
jgi:hypothetical protein